MDRIADKLVSHIRTIRRWDSPAMVLITFSDGSQAGFDASNDKRAMPTGDSTSIANEFARQTKTIRSGQHGPEVVFLDDSWIVCSSQNWAAMHLD